MKKTLLTLAVIAIAQFSYAQFSSSGGNTTAMDNVGIGTTSPSTSLEVTSASATTQINVARFDNATNGSYTSLTAAGSSSVVPTWLNGSQIVEFVPYSTGNGIISSYSGNLLFQTNNRTNRMIIDG